MKLSRNQQNYIVMTIVYDALTDLFMHKNETFRSFEELINDFSISEILSEMEAEIKDVQIDQYIIDMVNNSLIHYADIVNLISPNLKNWKWERIPLLSQAILLMSVSHYKYIGNIDKKIVINVAVELAKKYIEEKQAKFINAILDGVLK